MSSTVSQHVRNQTRKISRRTREKQATIAAGQVNDERRLRKYDMQLGSYVIRASNNITHNPTNQDGSSHFNVGKVFPL